jgi:hypothetical protein
VVYAVVWSFDKTGNQFYDESRPIHFTDGNPTSSWRHLGILGIEFATRRRNRVNGRIASNDGQKIEFKVDLSFGNCKFQLPKGSTWNDFRKERMS